MCERSIHVDHATINGQGHYLWRAVDQDGNILDILGQRRHDKAAAKTCCRKRLKGLTYVPRVIIADQLRSYGAASRKILPSVEHRQHRYVNNRAENSRQPTRQRERRIQRFKLPLQGTPSVSSRPTSRSCGTSVLNATASQPAWTARRWRNGFRPWRDIAGAAVAA